MKTALICIVFAMTIMGCESSKKAVADKPAAESKFNDIPLTSISLDAMEPSSSKVYLTSADDKFSFNTVTAADRKTKNISQGLHISRDTVVFPADSLKKFKN